jgi:hypothetical protein
MWDQPPPWYDASCDIPGWALIAALRQAERRNRPALVEVRLVAHNNRLAASICLPLPLPAGVTYPEPPSRSWRPVYYTFSQWLDDDVAEFRQVHIAPPF